MKLNPRIFQELKEKKISIEDLDVKYFIDLYEIKVEVKNILKLLNENICNFKEIVDKFKSIKDDWNKPCLYGLLWNREFLKELIKNTRLNRDDLIYLLNRIDNRHELDKLCGNTPLIECILNEFMLNKEIVDKLNAITENNEWCKNRNIHTIFEFIERNNKRNEEVLRLNELNKKVCLLNSFKLNEDQRLELIEVLRNNEIVKDRLIQIIDNYLESNYDFASLMNYLKKPEKKSILNI